MKESRVNESQLSPDVLKNVASQRVLEYESPLAIESDSNSRLTKDLENIFTIDGRGRPRKCKLLLELMKQYGTDAVIKEVEVMSQRKTF